MEPLLSPQVVQFLLSFLNSFLDFFLSSKISKAALLPSPLDQVRDTLEELEMTDEGGLDSPPPTVDVGPAEMDRDLEGAEKRDEGGVEVASTVDVRADADRVDRTERIDGDLVELARLMDGVEERPEDSGGS